MAKKEVKKPKEKKEPDISVVEIQKKKVNEIVEPYIKEN